jgi:hypothetical protein
MFIYARKRLAGRGTMPKDGICRGGCGGGAPPEPIRVLARDYWRLVRQAGEGLPRPRRFAPVCLANLGANKLSLLSQSTAHSVQIGYV